MIVTKLVGGLGNQMFQYAAGLSLSLKNDTQVKIDNSWFATNNSITSPRKYELDCFTLKPVFITPEQYMTDSNLHTNLGAKLKNLVHKPTTFSNFKEEGLRYANSFEKLPDNTVLDGYWQSELYFAEHRAAILEAFGFKKAPVGNNATLAKKIKDSTAVSLHVRRGDYASHAQTNSVHGLMGLGYYKAAIDYITGQIENVHFFVFSDEPEWCMENLPIEHAHTYVSGNTEGCYDMQLMTMCDHHIIANSSFSWWGAWLNPKESKRVIAPKQWFNDSSMDSSDIVPINWTRI